MSDFIRKEIRDFIDLWIGHRMPDVAADEDTSRSIEQKRDTKLPGSADDIDADGLLSAVSSDEHAVTELIHGLSRAERCLNLLDDVWPSVTERRAGDSSSDKLSRRSHRDAFHLLGLDDDQFGRFSLRTLLGRGGMGNVFLAFDTVLERLVALKIPHAELLLDPASRKRFLREARAAGRLRHPHLVGIYESGEIGPVCYIASEYCAGPNLAEWLKSQKQPVHVRIAACIVSNLAEGMQHSHDRGVLHRDLKPSNVLLEPVPGPCFYATTHESKRQIRSGRADEQAESNDLAPTPEQPRAGLFPYTPRITDFGLALSSSSDTSLTRDGTPIGTAEYMSPEQAAGSQQIGPATDVYSLGVILYEILTRISPFRQESVGRTLSAVQAGVVKLP
ncbi:MAG: serine/threonine protein kinase, partial [Planctomycetales bacterium]|nr:serine/threonine protein kinase [Planctomycetales bacterium]